MNVAKSLLYMKHNILIAFLFDCRYKLYTNTVVLRMCSVRSRMGVFFESNLHSFVNTPIIIAFQDGKLSTHMELFNKLLE